MGRPHVPEKVKIITSLFSRDMELLDKTKKSLEKFFGRTDYESPLLDFTHTEYYKGEMGEGLKRKFISFEKLRSLKNIYVLKLITNKLECHALEDGCRRINVDPGYLDLAKLVLFSTKDYIHRIYLDKGIYAEATLYYKDKSYKPWPWTYPDYATSAYIDIFNSIRERYKKNIRGT